MSRAVPMKQNHSNETLSRQLIYLRRALHEHDPKRPNYEVLLQYDEARLHVVVIVKNFLKTLKSEVLSNPPFSPDLVPFDYWLFRWMQKDFAVTGSGLLKKSKYSSMMLSSSVESMSSLILIPKRARKFTK